MKWKFFSLVILLFPELLAAQQALDPLEVARMLVPQNEPYQFTAIARGAQAMRINPASTYLSRGVNLYYNTYIQSRKLLEHDFLLQNFLFNISYRRASARSADVHLNQYTFSTGFGVDEFMLGVSLNLLRSNAPQGSNGTVWHFGALIIPEDWITFSAVKTNVKQPVIGGVKLQSMNIVGVGFQPPQLDLQIAVDLSVPNDARLKDFSYKVGADVVLVPGLHFFGVYDNVRTLNGAIQKGRSFSLGVRVLFPFVGTQYNANFDGSVNYRSGVATIWLTSDRNRTVFE